VERRTKSMARLADTEGRKSTLKGLSTYVTEHYPNSSYGVYPIENDSKVAVVIVANRYSPNNYW
jgi:capping protein alpha